MDTLKKTPLFNEHEKLKARMAPFGDWDMPIQYTGILNEYKQCRNSVSVFDTCHMGEFFFKGDLKNSGIDRAVSFSFDKLSIGKCKYGFLLNDKGGVIDDLIVYKIADNEVMIVVNSDTSDNDFEIMNSYVKSKEYFNNESSNTAKIDIQGPGSRDLLKNIVRDQIDSIKFFNFIETEILGEKAILSRTGYTGELGYEIYISNNVIVELWNKILSFDEAEAAGLGARDLLRLEMGYSLYGHELNTSTSPVNADLDFFIDYKHDFIGKDALLKQKKDGLKVIKTAFLLNSRRSPRINYKILNTDKKEIGTVTSGGFSPALSSGIGMGYIKTKYNNVDQDILISDGRSVMEAKITSLPFYKNNSLRK